MIEINPIEPNRLKLIWQSSGTDRTKYVVGELVRSSERVSLSYHWHQADFISAALAGFQGHPAFPYTTPVHHSNVIEVFSRRLPARQRSDFHEYLIKNRIRPNISISDFSLLGYTGAYLPSDGFSFAVDWRYQEMPQMFLMEVSGFRYYQGMEIEMSSLINRAVTLEPEPANLHDPNAVKVMLGPIHIGYVPRYYAWEATRWHQYYNAHLHIERIDGALSKPQVYLFASIGLKQNALLNLRSQ